MLEVETEISEDEAEEKVNKDDPGEDDRKYFIKRDGFEDDAKDTVEEEMMKQDEVPKDQEVIKKELTPGADITDAPGTKTEQDEALFNREEVPEARTELPRKSKSQHQKEQERQRVGKRNGSDNLSHH